QAAKPSMRASNRRVLDASARIDSPKDRKAKMQCQTILKCDSPAPGPIIGVNSRLSKRASNYMMVSYGAAKHDESSTTPAFMVNGTIFSSQQ
ncbi:MAG: hypothetical protein ACLP4V_18940, partial [Methylocella sp.]